MIRTLVASTLLFVSTPALALSCLFEWSDHRPELGATNVPLNQALLTGGPLPSGELILADADGTEVSTRIALYDGEGADAAVVVPTESLKPNTAYTLTRIDGAGEQIALEFTTGEELLAVDLPTTAGILEVESRKSNSMWGKTLGLAITLPAPSGDVAWHEVEVTREDGSSGSFIITRESFFLGMGPCTNSLPNTVAGEQLSLRARAVNAVGEPGEWVNWEGNSRTPGCSTTGGSAMGWLFLPTLLVVGRRRR